MKPAAILITTATLETMQRQIQISDLRADDAEKRFRRLFQPTAYTFPSEDRFEYLVSFNSAIFRQNRIPIAEVIKTATEEFRENLIKKLREEKLA